LPDKPSIAVLPFANMSEDPKQDSFSDGITEDLTADLAKISSLFVISRHSAFTYKGKTVKVQDVSRELGVRYVLEGSVRKADNQVRITAQLIDATTGGHVWSERYDRPLQNIFALQDEIRRKIVVHLALKLTDVEHESLKRAYTSSLEAYDYRLRGRKYIWSLTKETNAQARQMFERAITLDPTYAVAYTSLGFTYLLEWGFQWSQGPQALEQAFTLTQKAIALDDSLPAAHDVMGLIYLWRNKQCEQAIAEEERAIALGVSFTSAYGSMGTILNFAGRPAEAIDAIEKALRLEPRNPFFLSNYLTTLGGAYRLLGRNQEAITALKKALALNPNQLGAHLSLASIYSELGQETEAQAEVAEVLRISPNFSLEVWRQRFPYKDPAESERFLAALRKAGLK
jgi:adenylate cyclase